MSTPALAVPTPGNGFHTDQSNLPLLPRQFYFNQTRLEGGGVNTRSFPTPPFTRSTLQLS